MPAGRLFVPRDIQLDGDSLTWPWVPAGDEKRTAYRQANSGMLGGFIRLHETTDERILAYARRWGVLGICHHGLPCSHNQYPYGLHDLFRPCLPMLVPQPAGGSVFRLTEPLASWRAWSRKAQSLMNIGARLNQGKLAHAKDWRRLKEIHDSGLGTEEGEPFMRTMAKARAELGNELDGWISMGQVRPRISWRKDKARFSLDAVSSGPNLFGILALNIAISIAAGEGEKGLAVCSACSLSYIPTRRPDPNRSNYCSACGLKAAQRAASRRYRQACTNRRPGARGRP
jgi:hypothetical protein